MLNTGAGGLEVDVGGDGVGEGPVGLLPEPGVKPPLLGPAPKAVLEPDSDLRLAELVGGLVTSGGSW
jgi:hypothetical protein